MVNRFTMKTSIQQKTLAKERSARRSPNFGKTPISQVEPTGDVEQDFNNAMVALKDDNYEAFIEDLNTLATDPKIAYLRDAIIDKFNSPDGVSVQFSKAQPMDIKNIHPTQFEVDMEKSLNFPLNEKPQGIDDAFSGKPISIRNLPLVVAEVDGVFYIIDGHHRWSQVYCLNPDAQMVVRVLRSDMFKSADDVLKLVQMQLFIAKDGGELPQATVDSDYNLYTIEEGAFKKWCEQAMTEEARQIFSKYVKDDPINYLWGNVLLMRKEAEPTPNAHGRGDMPQTDKVNGEYMKPKAAPISEAIKKLKVTKERFEKSRYFKRKYGKLEFVSESGKIYKTSNGTVLRFVTEAREYVDDDSIDVDSAEEFIIFDDPDIFKKIAEVQKKEGQELQADVKDGEVNPEEVSKNAERVSKGNMAGATIAAAGGIASAAISTAGNVLTSKAGLGLMAAAGYKQALDKAAEVGDEAGWKLGNAYYDWKNRDENMAIDQKLAMLNKISMQNKQAFLDYAKISNLGQDTSIKALNNDRLAMYYANQLKSGEPIIGGKKNIIIPPEQAKEWLSSHGYEINKDGIVNKVTTAAGAVGAGAAGAAGGAGTAAAGSGWSLFGLSATTIGWIAAGVAAAAIITPYIYDKVRACTKTWLADIIAEVKFKADGKNYRCFYDLKKNKWVLTYADLKWTSYLDNQLDDETIEEFFASNFFKQFLDKCRKTFALLFSTSKNEVVFKTLPEIKDAPKELKGILEKMYDNKGAITKNLFTGNH